MVEQCIKGCAFVQIVCVWKLFSFHVTEQDCSSLEIRECRFNVQLLRVWKATREAESVPCPRSLLTRKGNLQSSVQC